MSGFRQVLQIALTKFKIRNFEDLKRVCKIILGFACFLVWWKYVRCQHHDSIPTMYEWNPIIGHLRFAHKHWHHMNEHLFKMVKERNFPPALAMTAHIPLYGILLLDPDVIKLVFDTEFLKFEKGPRIQIELEELLGQGIFTSDPPDWKFHRKVASRMFSMRNLKDYMFECTVKYTKSVLEVIEKNDMTNIDIYDIAARFTLDCFTDIAFGTSCDSLEMYPNTHAFAESFDTLMELFAFRHVIPPFIWKPMRMLNLGNEKQIKDHVKVINDFSDQVLDSRQSALSGISDESGSKYNDIISLFIKHEKTGKESSKNTKLTRRELKDIAMNMIIAGRDTTRLLISWFLYEMCKRPEICKKVYEEIDDYVKNNNSEEMTYSSILNALYYLESCLLESLRLNPVVPFLIRHAKEDVQLPNGQWIRAMNEVIIPTYTYARNPKVYKDAESFVPNRFYTKCINDGIAPINVFNVYQYPFFNINPRLCLGRKLALMEAKVFLFYFFRAYTFKMSDPNQKIEIKTGIVLNMKEGLRLNISKRSAKYDV